MGAREAAAELGRKLGDPAFDLAILAEGNTSAKESADRFWVKASGFSLCGITADRFVRIDSAPIIGAMAGELPDAGVKELLASSRADDVPLMPSVETFMHAYLLSLPGVEIVGHTHPTPMVSILSLPDSAEIAKLRLFPDEVVCCGPAAAYVHYEDPGLPLAKAIRSSVERFAEEYGMIPKTIWLENHGLIAMGKTSAEVESATFMSAKSARAWLGVLATGRTPRTLTQAQVERIHTRPDEHYRQRLLWDLREKPLQ
jgi:L-ribulose-5-phosphate 4-epimerase